MIRSIIIVLATLSASLACSSSSSATNLEQELRLQDVPKNDTTSEEMAAGGDGGALAQKSPERSNASIAVVCPEEELLTGSSSEVQMVFQAQINGTLQEADKNLRILNLTEPEQDLIDRLRESSIFSHGRNGILNMTTLHLIWVTTFPGEGAKMSVGKEDLAKIRDFCCRNPESPSCLDGRSPIEILPQGMDAGASDDESPVPRNRSGCPLVNMKLEKDVADEPAAISTPGLIAGLGLVSFICFTLVLIQLICRKGCSCLGHYQEQ